HAQNRVSLESESFRGRLASLFFDGISHLLAISTGGGYEVTEEEIIHIFVGVRQVAELDGKLVLIVQSLTIARQIILRQDFAQRIAHALRREDGIVEAVIGHFLNNRAIQLRLASVVGRGRRIRENGGKQVHALRVLCYE